MSVASGAPRRGETALEKAPVSSTPNRDGVGAADVENAAAPPPPAGIAEGRPDDVCSSPGACPYPASGGKCGIGRGRSVRWPSNS